MGEKVQIGQPIEFSGFSVQYQHSETINQLEDLKPGGMKNPLRGIDPESIIGAFYLAQPFITLARIGRTTGQKADSN